MSDTQNKLPLGNLI